MALSFAGSTDSTNSPTESARPDLEFEDFYVFDYFDWLNRILSQSDKFNRLMVPLFLLLFLWLPLCLGSSLPFCMWIYRCEVHCDK